MVWWGGEGADKKGSNRSWHCGVCGRRGGEEGDRQEGDYYELSCVPMRP